MPSVLRRGAVWALCWTAASVWMGGPAAADDSQSKYFHELRARRLFSLAERYCLERLGQTELSPAERADWTIELSRTFTRNMPPMFPQISNPFIGAARHRLPQRSSRRNADRRSGSWWNCKPHLVPVDRGAWLRLQSELMPDDDSYKRQSQEQLLSGIDRLDAVEQSLAEQIPQGDQPVPSAAEDERELSPFELREQLQIVRFRMGIAFLDLADVLPVGAAARTSALVSAAEMAGTARRRPSGRRHDLAEPDSATARCAPG